jgi:hypothetical protein
VVDEVERLGQADSMIVGVAGTAHQPS